MLGMRLPELKPPDPGGEFALLWETIQETKGRVFETANRRKDGSEFPTEISARLIEVGDRRYCQSIIRDITERKQAERQIKRSNHLYAVLSRCNAVAVRALSAEDLLREVCKIAVESGGFRLSWIGTIEPATQMVTALTRAGAAVAYMDEVRIMAANGPLSKGPTGTCVRESRASEARDFATEPRLVPWREASARHGIRSSVCIPIKRKGQLAYLMGLYSSEVAFFSDEEIALAEEVGASLSHALDRLGGYWDWKVDTDEWYLSPRYRTMLGYEQGAETFGLCTLRDITHPDDLPLLDSAIGQFLEPGTGTVSIEFRIHHGDGHYIWVHSRAKAVAYDESGQPKRIIGTHGDITERKRLQEQFLQAQKLESVGRLAGGVAHDFNNHLTVINGYADLLRMGLQHDSALAEPLKAIREAGERAAALTRQLLAVSRNEIEHKEPADPNAVIMGMQKMLSRLMGENVELRLDLGMDVGWVMADVMRLEQVLMNLAINARDAVEETGNITIRTEGIELRGAAPWPD
ncbi:MAG: PAS domain S-box protein, partial [Candidatus Solibacter sp.]|nr:PAS domain S-box protein [Candidatus Solibacter sp.]